MARPVKEVLTGSELKKIESIEGTISDLSKAHIICNAGHIACDMYTNPETNEDVVQARVYIDSRQPYRFVYEKLGMKGVKRAPSKAAKEDYKLGEHELFERRRRHFSEFRGRPHERKAFEAWLRSDEIHKDRYYIDKAEGKDPGLFVASAHWLKEYSDIFCEQLEEHYNRLNHPGFSLEGLERAVVIKAPGLDGNWFHSVIVLSHDLTCEETAAQYASGIVRLAQNGDPSFPEKAKTIRQKLEEAEGEMRLCILGGRRI